MQKVVIGCISSQRWDARPIRSGKIQILATTQAEKSTVVSGIISPNPTSCWRKMRNRILSISYDPSLLETRHRLLEKAGYEVVSAVSFDNAIEKCRGEFDLVIMGHSIPQREKRALVEQLHNHGCDAPLLSLLRIGEEPIAEATRGIDPSPQRLMDTVKEMLAE